MIFPGGGGKAEDTALFGKYQICRVIGQGRSGTVYLARHLGLDEYRAVKRVAKEEFGDDFSREALVLKSLRHPGIPIIYDLEEDQNYYYLIEEYLDGESLFSLIERQGNLTRAKVISFGIELCQIMDYLHSLQPYPILYLDLQPKNLILCDGALKLIDFDQAVSAAFADRLKRRYGTAGCAAPEQYTGEPLDIRTDIYAVGALLYYMGTGAFPGGEESVSEAVFGEELAAVIGQCLRPSREERYGSAGCLLAELQKLGTGHYLRKQISLLKFAVAGGGRGMGATHVSLGLSSYLSGRGIHNLYMEANASQAVRSAADGRGLKPDSFGIYHLDHWDLRPQYGGCVKLGMPEYRAAILDFGDGLEEALREPDCALLLVICGGKWWELKDTLKALDLARGMDHVRIVFNHLPCGMKPAVSREAGSFSCFRLPYFSDPGALSREAAQCFEELLAGTEAGYLAGTDAGRGEKRAGTRRAGKLWERKKRKAQGNGGAPKERQTQKRGEKFW